MFCKVRTLHSLNKPTIHTILLIYNIVSQGSRFSMVLSWELKKLIINNKSSSYFLEFKWPNKNAHPLFLIQKQKRSSNICAINKMLFIVIFGSFSFSLPPLEAKTSITIPLFHKISTNWSMFSFQFILREITMTIFWIRITMTIKLQENLST